MWRQDLRVVPDEMVRDASIDVAPPAAGGYAPQTLARLRRRLDADYIVSGSYLVSGAEDDAPLRVDIALQDARNGAVLASVSNQAGLRRAQRARRQKRAPDCVTNWVSHRPGVRRSASIANEQPPNVDVARRVGFRPRCPATLRPGSRARRIARGRCRGSRLRSRIYLSCAKRGRHSGTGTKPWRPPAKRPKMRRIFRPNNVSRPRRSFESERSNWIKAAEAWQALVKLRPLNPEYRLHQIDAQIAAGEARQAQLTLAGLRLLAGCWRPMRAPNSPPPASRPPWTMRRAMPTMRLTRCVRRSNTTRRAWSPTHSSSSPPPKRISASGRRPARTSRPRSKAIARSEIRAAKRRRAGRSQGCSPI